MSLRFSPWGRSSSIECLPRNYRLEKQLKIPKSEKTNEITCKSVVEMGDSDREGNDCFLSKTFETQNNTIEMNRGADFEDVTKMFRRSFEINKLYLQRCSVDSGHASFDSEMSPDSLRSSSYPLDEKGTSESIGQCIQVYSSPSCVSSAVTARTHRSCSTDSAIEHGNEDVTCLSLPFETRSNTFCVMTSDSDEKNREEVHRKRSLTIMQSVSCPMLTMPSVVISDHSSFTDQDLQIVDDYMKPSQDCLQVTLDDIAGCIPKNRRLSNSSSCSFMSSLSSVSWDDDACQSDVSETSVASSSKLSGWKKVRNIVHLCPFLQTYRKQKYPWVQLAGHQGNFKVGDQGSILKKLCGKEEACLKKLMNDSLKPFVPEFKGRVVTDEGEIFLELQDLLAGFEKACVMDVKIGLRTYLEDELAKAKAEPKLRKDMYEKMVHIDPTEPSEEEQRLKAITKPRYMVWRETISSTTTLGFRVEGIKKADGSSTKDFKKTKTKEQVLAVLKTFTDGYPDVVKKYMSRLKDLYSVLEKSKFFASHELIGSSLLFVHDAKNAGIWLIDFAKTRPLPPEVHISHHDPWQMGNHEDGFLLGLKNLVHLFQVLQENK
ncbi:inositol-trisphosphate 3-kinase A-like [Limulus polyphemus]|uniref:Kinase n=1 Tax=Limulus polyphemus TaxID=6850 RepID=A0ABM1B1C4_LIMPO|nr:inositol-trisphosphate 3-kinase A-like [Limulus polyphemus]XP_022239632.1 inositol-trisphosphate 3-kinase A-like [Limulus polyphemus]